MLKERAKLLDSEQLVPSSIMGSRKASSSRANNRSWRGRATRHTRYRKLRPLLACKTHNHRCLSHVEWLYYKTLSFYRSVHSGGHQIAVLLYTNTVGVSTQLQVSNCLNHASFTAVTAQLCCSKSLNPTEIKWLWSRIITVSVHYP